MELLGFLHEWFYHAPISEVGAWVCMVCFILSIPFLLD